MSRKNWISKGIVLTMTAAIAMIGLAAIGNAATLCVEKSGANGCYTTINAAINAAVDGDTISVGPGTYPETVIMSKNDLHLIGNGPDKTFIVGSAQGVSFPSNKYGEVGGFNIKGGNTHAINLPGDNGGSIIHNNVISGSGADGIYSYSCNSGIKIINNVISHHPSDGIRDGCSDANEISNNIIHSNGAWGIVNGQSQYNNVYGNTAGTISGVLVSVGNISQNAQFVNDKQCALQSGSPSLNAGWPVGTYNDPDGTRNDQGACGGPGSASFWPYPSGGPVITDLTVTPASVPQGGTVTIRATGEVR